MLGRNLKLTRYVVGYELTEEGIVVICDEVIKAYTRAHEYLFYALDLLNLGEHMRVFGMIDLQILTRGGGKALFIRANAAFLLLIAGGVAEVGGGAADVVDIALEVGECRDLLCLGNNAALAS